MHSSSGMYSYISYFPLATMLHYFMFTFKAGVLFFFTFTSYLTFYFCHLTLNILRIFFSPGSDVFFLYVTLCIFLSVFPCDGTFLFITYQSVMFSSFLLLFPLSYLHLIMIFPFHLAFFYSPMIFKGFTFHFYTHLFLYITFYSVSPQKILFLFCMSLLFCFPLNVFLSAEQ